MKAEFRSRNSSAKWLQKSLFANSHREFLSFPQHDVRWYVQKRRKEISWKTINPNVRNAFTIDSELVIVFGYYDDSPKAGGHLAKSRCRTSHQISQNTTIYHTESIRYQSATTMKAAGIAVDFTHVRHTYAAYFLHFPLSTFQHIPDGREKIADCLRNRTKWMHNLSETHPKTLPF